MVGVADDNWLVDHAYHDVRIMLVDVTATVPLLHLSQANDDGHASRHAEDALHNYDLVFKYAKEFNVVSDFSEMVSQA